MPFADLGRALARAQARLQAVQADPARLRLLALRSLAGFRWLVEPALHREALQSWLEAVVPDLPPLPGDPGAVADAALIARVVQGLPKRMDATEVPPRRGDDLLGTGDRGGGWGPVSGKLDGGWGRGG